LLLFTFSFPAIPADTKFIEAV